MTDWIAEEMREAARLFAAVADDADLRAKLEKSTRLIVETVREGGRILTLGNGGSAADATHLAEELTGRYKGDRRSLPAISLASCGATLTCIANDYGFDAVFARQVEAHGRRGDALVAISTSGNSPNVLRALETARSLGLRTVGFLGKGGGKAADRCDVALVVPHAATARIQEVHGLFLHLICEALERACAEEAPEGAP